MDSINAAFEDLNKNLLEINSGKSNALQNTIIDGIIERFDEVLLYPALQPIWQECKKHIIPLSKPQHAKLQSIVEKIINADFSQKSKIALICARHNVDVGTYEHFMQKYNGNIHGVSGNTTPVSEAVTTNQPEILKVLKALGADVNKPRGDGDTPMILAVLDNRIDMVKLLKEELHADIDKPAEAGVKHTPMTLAVSQNNIAMVKELQKLGADVNKPRGDGDTPMVLAVLDDHIDMVKILKEELHADIDKPAGSSGKGHTPMSLAVSRNNIKMVKELNKLGADVNKLGDGNTPMVFALINQNKDMETLLQGHGADKEFAQEYLRRKFLAHAWGIKGLSKLQDQSGNETQFELEGLPHYYAMRNLGEYFKEFLDSNRSIKKKDQLEILESLENIVSEVSNNHAESISRLHSGKPIVLLSGSHNHTISIILYKDQLVVFNRGEGKYDQSARVYQLPSAKVDEAMLKKLSTRCSDMNAFNTMIASFNLPYLYAFKHKDQKVGNCTLASSKGAFGVLCRLYTRETTMKMVFKHPAAFMRNKGELQKHTKGQKLYKEFTAFMRNKALQDYLNQTAKKKQDSDLVNQIQTKRAKKKI